MAFDKPTRNKLAAMVAKARGLLVSIQKDGTKFVVSGEFARQFRTDYGIEPATGIITPLADLKNLDDTQLSVARLLRDRIHYLEENQADVGGRAAIVHRVLREQAFTVLNRFAALRMAEERGIIIESVAEGSASKGFKVYSNLCGPSMGDTFEQYRAYIFSIFDEISVDLGVLFDRFSPTGLLFPEEAALNELLDTINDPELAHIWAEDETIGWVYQYYNDPEERKRMRKESSAPRNSRELAVRNQFFTPRYVVEFLVDNTLGRIWYEMTKGKTRLAEQCRYLVRRPTEIFLGEGEDAPAESAEPGSENQEPSQEELLRQPVHIPHRPVKDPREIRLLDPACGSMHFGIYAFDLFEAIYEEAWDKGDCHGLQDAYPEKADYLRDVPRLIIEHNIHGVDIDPRAVQIAGLSLWLRAQKTWRDTPAAERPRVRRSNIVCAEPMPGSEAMLEDFVPTLDPPLLGEFVNTVFDKMQLAGEAGTLLKIEEEIRAAIDDARQAWEKLQRQSPELFSTEELNKITKQQELGIFGGALRTPGSQLSGDFFDTAEERIYAALRDYAKSAEAGDYQRRLFAEDAAHGFAFIDLCRKRYDAVVMNPPFGGAAGNFDIKTYGKATSNNLICAFVLRAIEISEPTGVIATVNDATVFIKSSYEHFRKSVWSEDQTLQHCVNLGWDVLDGANVEVGLMVIAPSNPYQNFASLDARLTPEEALLSYSTSKKRDASGSKLKLLYVDSEMLKWIPNISFPLSEDVLVHVGADRLRDIFGSAKQGVAPVDSFRVMRLKLEIPPHQIGKNNTWMGVNKGGEYCPFYRDICDVLNWSKSGIELKEDILRRYPYLNGNVGWVAKNEEYYGRPGLCYGKRTDFLSVQILPPDVIITVEGIGLYPLESIDPFTLLGVINSRFAAHILNTFCGQHKYSGYVDQLPVPNFTTDQLKTLRESAAQGFRICREIETNSALSPLYTIQAIDNLNLSDISANYREKVRSGKQAIQQILCELDAVYLEHWKSISPEVIREYQPDEDFTTTSFLLDIILGYPFGRWDIRYATGERQSPELPAPFDPLPVCPPGMLQSADGLPAANEDVPDDYPLAITWPGILVDDELHVSKEGTTEDIVARIRETLGAIWGGDRDAINQEACEILGVRNLREYFAEKKSGGKFFKDHLKRYSKSRRKAPIYWPLSTESGSYTLWIYYHRLDDQFLYKAVNMFVSPKIEEVQGDLARLVAIPDEERERDWADKKEDLEAFERELADFRDELQRVAELPWKPNLNDGVQITAAPLWKLFRHTAWRKKLKETWEKLEKGDYDWAHLAYSIWPDRVREKCKTDKSLAIAHDLEDVYIEPPPKPGKKKRASKKKAEPEATQQELLGPEDD